MALKIFYEYNLFSLTKSVFIFQQKTPRGAHKRLDIGTIHQVHRLPSQVAGEASLQSTLIIVSYKFI